MRMAVDGWRMSGKRTGVGRYLLCVIEQWTADHPFDEIVLFTPKPVDAAVRLPPRCRNVVISPPGTRPLWRHLMLWENLVIRQAAAGFDVLYSPSYTIPIAYQNPCVVANHGIYMNNPADWPLWQRLRFPPFYRYAVQHADAVVVNSKATGRDLIHHLGARPGKLRVVYFGIDPRCRLPRSAEELRAAAVRATGADAPYFLFVGKMSRRRNIPTVVKAFRILRERHNLPHHLLFVGPNHLNVPLADLVAENKVGGLVHHHEHLDFEQVAPLFKGADAFVLPTESEGFSMTIPEAMSSGTPVVTLRHDALDEGLTEGVLAIEPADFHEESLAAAMHRTVTDRAFHDDLSARGLAIAAKFDWANTARETMAILTEAARRNR